MLNFPSHDCVAAETWANAQATDDADACAAGLPHEHDHPCPRGSQCRCARPIGHPVAVELATVELSRRGHANCDTS